MRSKKILTGAIVASLLALKAGGVLAAPTVTLVNGSSPGTDGKGDLFTDVPAFAKELFTYSTGSGATIMNVSNSTLTTSTACDLSLGAAGVYVNGADATGGYRCFLVKYTTGLQLSKPAQNAMLTLSLSTGTWGHALNAANSVKICSSESYSTQGVNCSALSGVVVSKGSKPAGTGDLDADFFVQPAQTDIKPDDVFLFAFDVDDLKALSTEGASLSFGVKGQVQAFEGDPGFSRLVPEDGSPLTTPIARSTKGVNVTVQATKRGDSPIYVDVASGEVKFVGGESKDPAALIDRKSDYTVLLGEIIVDRTNSGKHQDGVNIYNPPPASTPMTLTVTNGIFSASTGARTNVFLNFADDGTLDAGDVPVNSTFSATTAVWTSLGAKLLDFAVGETKKTAYITVTADAKNKIATYADAPLGVIAIGTSSNVTTYSGNLRHIRDNGKRCTLYNIPNGVNSTDRISVRVTNNTDSAGKVVGTLRNKDGTTIFSNKPLADIAPRQTIRFNAGETKNNLDLYEEAKKAGTAALWQGRAVLTISTNLSSMEVYGLAINKAGGSPMNLSIGATGNGCNK